jgi:hypothetical protein
MWYVFLAAAQANKQKMPSSAYEGCDMIKKLITFSGFSKI